MFAVALDKDPPDDKHRIEILSQEITATDDPGDSETAIAMHVIVAAFMTSAKYNPMAERLREAKLWDEGSLDDRE